MYPSMPFREIYFPELVTDVRKIFWEHIDPLAFQPLPAMRKEGIIGFEQPERYPDQYKQIAEIREKYPFLDRHMLLFKLRPGFATDIHLDGHPENGRVGQRNVSINIPISGCNETGLTEFYDNPEEDLYLEKRFNVRVMKKDIIPNKTLEYALKENPFLVNPQYPHRVNNINNSEYRITVSWTIDLDWTWDYAQEYFSNKFITVDK
jgi:hypothetical protein